MDPEYASVEAFVEYTMADDRTTFSLYDVVTLAENTRTSNPKVIHELKSYGLSMEERKPAKEVRGFQSNSHDRWYGPGSSASHGGSGWEQITGFAGRNG